eukprot:2301281-Pyramimonas_sp.AAC.1
MSVRVVVTITLHAHVITTVSVVLAAKNINSSRNGGGGRRLKRSGGAVNAPTQPRQPTESPLILRLWGASLCGRRAPR